MRPKLRRPSPEHSGLRPVVPCGGMRCDTCCCLVHTIARSLVHLQADQAVERALERIRLVSLFQKYVAPKIHTLH